MPSGQIHNFQSLVAKLSRSYSRDLIDEAIERAIVGDPPPPVAPGPHAFLFPHLAQCVSVLAGALGPDYVHSIRT